MDEVRPLLAKGAVVISPQFVGSGIRIKSLTAMACGNAVVATAVACEGLPVEHGRDIFIADDEEAYADCVCRLMESAEQRASMGRAARSLVEQRFGWPAIAEELEAHLREAISHHAAVANA